LAGIKKGLRSGYTTGACAAAAAKAAALLVTRHASRVTNVEIPFPDGSRVKFRVHSSGFRDSGKTAWASVIKDAGDDPDVTNGAEIKAEVKIQGSGVRSESTRTEGQGSEETQILIKGGKGVGIVTKPGLPVPVGEPAINPVPRMMIEEAVMEAVNQRSAVSGQRVLEITISVPNGEELAKKTLNSRLGILSGISILGTTGIVRPVSTEAWTATITSSMDVARAMGIKEIVLSAGRTSEKAHMKTNKLPEESYVLMGDYLEYSLKEAKRHGFKRIYLCAQWAKMLKIAMATPQTHVRFGAINIKKAVDLLNSHGIKVPAEKKFNTAREIFEYINSEFRIQNSEVFQKICDAARKYAEKICMIPVTAGIVSYTGEIIAESE
jgi:cobalt-precorrin-5B (C1)-methyltransferase